MYKLRVVVYKSEKDMRFDCAFVFDVKNTHEAHVCIDSLLVVFENNEEKGSVHMDAKKLYSDKLIPDDFQTDIDMGCCIYLDTKQVTYRGILKYDEDYRGKGVSIELPVGTEILVSWKTFRDLFSRVDEYDTKVAYRFVVGKDNRETLFYKIYS